MDNLTLLKLEQSETQDRINEKCKEFQSLEAESQKLERKIAELTNLKSFCLSIPRILRDKIKSGIKLVPALTLLSTLLITSIVACMGYTLETGWQIKEIITALIASSSISGIASTSLAVYSYKSLKKDLSGYNIEQVSQELKENSREFDLLLDEIDIKESELNLLESKLYELDNQIRQLVTNTTQHNPGAELETLVIKQENQKVKSLNLNTK